MKVLNLDTSQLQSMI